MSDIPTPRTDALISKLRRCDSFELFLQDVEESMSALERELTSEKRGNSNAFLQPLMRSKAEKGMELLRDALHRANVAVAHHLMVENSSAINPELQARIQAALDATA